MNKLTVLNKKKINELSVAISAIIFQYEKKLTTTVNKTYLINVSKKTISTKYLKYKNYSDKSF